MLVYLDPLQLLLFIIDKNGNIIIMDSRFLFEVRPAHLFILLSWPLDRRGETSGVGFYLVSGGGIISIYPFLGYPG